MISEKYVSLIFELLRASFAKREQGGMFSNGNELNRPKAIKR